MNDDQLLLANAYLDAEVDDDERTRAEADAEVMAEVERLRALRAALRDVEPADGARRDRSVAAALAALDIASGDGPASRPTDRGPVPVPLPHRPRRAWWGVGAAAAALVVVAGVGLALSSADDNDDRGDSAAELELRTNATEALRPAEASDDDAPAATAVAGSEGESATEGTQAAAASAPAADAGGVSTTVAAAPASGAPPPVLSTPAELVRYVSATVRQDAVPTATCSQDGTSFGTVLYAGTLVEVFATPTEVVAVDAGTCAVVERVGR